MRVSMAATSPPPSSQRQTKSVFVLAISSRILVLSVMVIFRSIATPYDTSGSLNPPCISNTREEHTSMVTGVGKALEESVVWDSVYYVRIAQCGYEYEQTYAFLPLLPLSMRFLSKTVLAAFVPVMGERAVLALSGYVISNIAFVVSALFFYKLTLIIFKDTKTALRATALFCFNPASIFYSSIYTESLFSLLSFAGIYYLLSGMNWKASILFAMSSAARSNGVINAGFILFQAMHQAYEAFFQEKMVLLGMQVLLVACLQSLCVLLPFLIFQLYGFRNICEGGLSSQGSRPWCIANVPYLYGFVQSHYWNVGFLHYFQLKQLPNFLLASPMLMLGICSTVEYAMQNYRLLFSLGFCVSDVEKEEASIFYFAQMKMKMKKIAEPMENLSNPSSTFSLPSESLSIRHRAKSNKNTNIHTSSAIKHSSDDPSLSQMKQGFFSTLTTPFIVQLAFMLFVASFVMHVQVTTRFLSVSPPIYWYACHLIEASPPSFKLGYTIWTVFLSYLFFGSLLFSNFYPFT